MRKLELHVFPWNEPALGAVRGLRLRARGLPQAALRARRRARRRRAHGVLRRLGRATGAWRAAPAPRARRGRGRPSARAPTAGTGRVRGGGCRRAAASSGQGSLVRSGTIVAPPAAVAAEIPRQSEVPWQRALRRRLGLTRLGCRGRYPSSSCRSGSLSVSDARAISAATDSIACRLSRRPARRSSATARVRVSRSSSSASCRRACTASSSRASRDRSATGQRVFARATSSATDATRWSIRSSRPLSSPAVRALDSVALRVAVLDPLEPRSELVERRRAQLRERVKRFADVVDDRLDPRARLREVPVQAASSRSLSPRLGRCRLDGRGKRVESLGQELRARRPSLRGGDRAAPRRHSGATSSRCDRLASASLVVATRWIEPLVLGRRECARALRASGHTCLDAVQARPSASSVSPRRRSQLRLVDTLEGVDVAATGSRARRSSSRSADRAAPPGRCACARGC